MKPTILLLMMLSIASCSKQIHSQMGNSIDITVIHDHTDSLCAKPEIDPILSLYDFNNNPSVAARYRMIAITDRQLNPAVDIAIDKAEVTEAKNGLDEIQDRHDIIMSFINACRKETNDFSNHYHAKSLAHSECFATIASELELLAHSHSSTRILIIFSDLLENSEAFNCYSHEGKWFMNSNPEKVEQLLLKHRNLPGTLRGITVVFVFNPLNRENDKEYRCMYQIYQHMLVTRGARVLAQAQTDNYRL